MEPIARHTKDIKFVRDANGELISAKMTESVEFVSSTDRQVSFEYPKGISRELLVKNIKEILECVSHPTYPIT